MICSFRQILFVFRLSYKADKYRSLFCFLYHLWVTFVNLVFLTLLPRWLIVAYEQKISWFRVLAVYCFYGSARLAIPCIPIIITRFLNQSPMSVFIT